MRATTPYPDPQQSWKLLGTHGRIEGMETWHARIRTELTCMRQFITVGHIEAAHARGYLIDLVCGHPYPHRAP